MVDRIVCGLRLVKNFNWCILVQQEFSLHYKLLKRQAFFTMHQVAWKKPFARELEEKIQIGIDHDFIGHHNRRSGYYASNEQGMLRNHKNNKPINLRYCTYYLS